MICLYFFTNYQSHLRVIYLKTREKRVIRQKRLVNKLKHPKEPGMLWFFSDTKNFDQDQKMNRRNNKQLCAVPMKVTTMMPTKFTSLMVLGIATNEGHSIHPHFCLQTIRLNTTDYTELLDTVMKPLIEGAHSRRKISTIVIYIK